MPLATTDYYDHPVFQPNRLQLDTPAMQTLHDTVHRWLWTGCTGGVVIGAARVGKTTALLALARQLYTRGKTRIPGYYLSMPDRDQRTIMSVFRQLCQSVNLPVKTQDRADHLADRFAHYLIDKAVEADSQQAVLIVDEMQRLWPAQFNAFAELHDKLLLVDIVLTVIFVGNDQECSSLMKAIRAPEYAHIRGRFFTQGGTFLGLTSAKQVHDCLRQYDNLRYPDDGPNYTEYFLPEAVKAGWRLASLSSDIWRVFREYQTNYKIPSWGMQYFIATVNTLLSDYLPRYEVEHFDDDMLHECIRISGLVGSDIVLET